MRVRYKKGDPTDGVVLLITLFIIAIVFLIYGFVFPSIAVGLNQTGLFTANNTQDAIGQFYDLGTEGINQGFLILFAGLILAQFISAFAIRVNNIFLIIYFFTMVLAGFLAIYLGNSFEVLTQLPTFSTTVTQQPILVWVMGHILIITIAVDIMTMVLIFAKIGQPQV